MWSLRLAFDFSGRFLCFLYSAGVIPNVALEISAVKIAKSRCSLIPRSFHSSVRF
jgi:hypothetical protein